MPPAPREFPAAGRSGFQPRLETGRRETGRICCQVRAASRRRRGFFEEEETYAGRDWRDIERAVEYQSADELPGVPPMKRVFHHPPEPTTGKRYWRSLGELSDTPEFQQWLEREFPPGAPELNGSEWSRRDFLKLMGASMALAGAGLTSCRRPELHL